MKENHFVFADLSTYDLQVAKGFYSSVFNWNYHSDSNNYLLAFHRGKEVSGLYETPQKFKEMKMPSFWMSYIQVEDVEATVAKARALGGIVELVDPDAAIGSIALIRDPLGAGFTIYGGDKLKSRFENQANALVWNELFISDIQQVKPFYEGIFDWEIAPSDGDRYFILDSKRAQIGAIQEVSNELKGKYEYWGVFFAVSDVEATKQKVLQQGGTLIYEDTAFTSMADSFGAFFHLVSMEGNIDQLQSTPRKSSFKWKAIFGLGLISISFLTGWSWIWAIFFAFWVYSDLRSGKTHLFEPIARKDQPLLYWVVVLVWALLGTYSVIYYYQG